MSETHGCCAHLKVTWRTKPVGNGAVTGWWQCEICPTHFFPVLATPASTARTDGWVDAKVHLPKAPETNDDPEFVYVKWTEAARWSGDEDEDNPRSASGYDTCLIAYLLENPKLISHWQPLPAAPGSVPQAPDPMKDDSRCAICAWPLAESAEKGCVRANCSQRPFPEVFYDLERANREYGNKFGVPARVPQAEPPKEEKQ